MRHCVPHGMTCLVTGNRLRKKQRTCGKAQTDHTFCPAAGGTRGSNKRRLASVPPVERHGWGGRRCHTVPDGRASWPAADRWCRRSVRSRSHSPSTTSARFVRCPGRSGRQCNQARRYCRARIAVALPDSRPSAQAVPDGSRRTPWWFWRGGRSATVSRSCTTRCRSTVAQSLRTRL